MVYYEIGNKIYMKSAVEKGLNVFNDCRVKDTDPKCEVGVSGWVWFGLFIFFNCVYFMMEIKSAFGGMFSCCKKSPENDGQLEATFVLDFMSKVAYDNHMEGKFSNLDETYSTRRISREGQIELSQRGKLLYWRNKNKPLTHLAGEDLRIHYAD